MIMYRNLSASIRLVLFKYIVSRLRTMRLIFLSVTIIIPIPKKYGGDINGK